MINPHLPWKFHANRSASGRFLIILLTKKQSNRSKTIPRPPIYRVRGKNENQCKIETYTVNTDKWDAKSCFCNGEVVCCVFCRCLESTQSDFVEFRDVETELLGRGAGHRRQRDRRLCSTPTGDRPVYAVLVMSTSFTLTFHSNSVYDGTGFTANYQFHQHHGLTPDSSI